MGKGAFQELDQVAAARQLCKFAERATSAAAVPGIIQHAFEVGVFRQGLFGSMRAYPRQRWNVWLTRFQQQADRLANPPSVLCTAGSIGGAPRGSVRRHTLRHPVCTAGCRGHTAAAAAAALTAAATGQQCLSRAGSRSAAFRPTVSRL